MSDIPQDRYWLVAHDKPSLLTHMMKFLAGNAHISLEGFLSNCQFPASVQQLEEEASVLKRNTISPRLDFTILSLEENTITPILNTILPNNCYKDDIIHIQIEKQGQLQFGSYDNFHKDCIVCFSGVPTKFLDELKQKGIIKSWTRPSEGAVRWHG